MSDKNKRTGERNSKSGNSKKQGGSKVADKKKKKEHKNLTTVTGTTPGISDAEIDAVIALSDDTCTWCRLVDGGFKFVNQDKIVPELVGCIIRIKSYLIKFDSNDRQPEKLPHVESDVEIPAGFSRRTDIKINVDGTIVGLSLPLSSAKYQLSPYLKYLKNQGIRPDGVVTRITSKRASNPLGTFNVAVFRLVNSTKEPSGAPPAQALADYPVEWA